MSQTDLIGWGSMALFGAFFVLLYRFIVTPSRKLEKTLKDGRALGLRRLSRDAPEFAALSDDLGPFLGTHGKSFQLGSLYQSERGNGQTGRGNAFLFSLVEISKTDRAGGESTEHQDHEKAFWCVPNRLAPFVVRRRPRSGPGVELLTCLPGKPGLGVHPVDSGLLPMFQASFIVYGGTTPTAVPPELQRLFVDACIATPSTGAPTALDELEGISFTPEGFLIHLSSRLRARSLEQLRQVLQFGERVERVIASGFAP